MGTRKDIDIQRFVLFWSMAALYRLNAILPLCFFGGEKSAALSLFRVKGIWRLRPVRTKCIQRYIAAVSPLELFNYFVLHINPKFFRLRQILLPIRISKPFFIGLVWNTCSLLDVSSMSMTRVSFRRYVSIGNFTLTKIFP